MKNDIQIIEQNKLPFSLVIKIGRFKNVYYSDATGNCKLGYLDNIQDLSSDDLNTLFNFIRNKVNKSHLLLNVSDFENFKHKLLKLDEKFVWTVVGNNPIGYRNRFQTLILFQLKYSTYEGRIKNFDIFNKTPGIKKVRLTKEEKDKLKSYKTETWRNKYIDSL